MKRETKKLRTWAISWSKGALADVVAEMESDGWSFTGYHGFDPFMHGRVYWVEMAKIVEAPVPTLIPPADRPRPLRTAFLAAVNILLATLAIVAWNGTYLDIAAERAHQKEAAASITTLEHRLQIRQEIRRNWKRVLAPEPFEGDL